MKIHIPTEEEHKQQKKKKRIQAVLGFLAGLLLFSFIGLDIFIYGFAEVKIYTWIALVFGVISFSFLAYAFGTDFWNTFR